ncbi:MAG: enoyl-CoA hydratase-related protein [bacterium]
MSTTVTFEKILLTVDNGLATLTLNDPAGLNVMGYQMAADLRAATDQLSSIEGLRCVLLNAAGKHFCGGGDLKAMQVGFDSDPKAFFERALVDIHAGVLNLHYLPVPVITAVQGFAAGAGANLALVGDLILAADNASFFQAFIQVGLPVDSGGSWFLPRAIGDKRALYYLMTGTKMAATEAATLGLVSRVVPAEELQTEAVTLAQQIAAGPTQAYAQLKRLVAGHHENDLATQLEAELGAQIACGKTGDFQRGVNAFLAKQAVEFEGQ